VQAAIERRAYEMGLAAVGLWAQVPHYLAAMPYPPSSVALLDGLGTVAGLDVGNDALRSEADATRQRVDALVNENEEHKEMVHQLEVSVDAEQESTDTALGVGPLPSGDELAAELERFLRDQGT
jgi:hypothetical protein